MLNQDTMLKDSKGRKCGLFTFHSAQNYGAFFQTYALVKALHKIGIETDVIDYRPGYLEMQQLDKSVSLKILPPFSWKKLLTKVWIIVDFVLNYTQKRTMNQIFQVAIDQYLPLSEKRYSSEAELQSDSSLAEKYQIYIAGSDQIWNPERTGEELDSVYFLSGVSEHKQKIAYAASMGDIRLPKKEEQKFQSLVQDFAYISVREKSAISYVQEFASIPVESTLDPTLLLDKDEWEMFACEPKTHPSRFIVAYYNGSIGKSFISFSRKVAKQYHLEIVWINVKNCYSKYLRKYNFIRLEEFIWYFSHAEFILTDSFHGTMFSIINKKSFYTIVSGWQKIRLVDHLEQLGIADRFVESPKEIGEITKDIDYVMVDNKLLELKEKSYQYLRLATEMAKCHSNL